jgi:hypothetical protein
MAILDLMTSGGWALRTLRDYLSLGVTAARIDAVRVTIRNETGSRHHGSHCHLKLSDRVDATVRLKDFKVLGNRGSDEKTLTRCLKLLEVRRTELLHMWDEVQAGRRPPSLGQLAPRSVRIRAARPRVPLSRRELAQAF